MKQSKKNTPPQTSKSKKRHRSFNVLPENIQQALNNAKITYSVETVGEYIHPDVKARLDETKKKQQE